MLGVEQVCVVRWILYKASLHLREELVVFEEAVPLDPRNGRLRKLGLNFHSVLFGRIILERILSQKLLLTCWLTS